MHEVALAQALIQGAETAARDAGLTRVTRLSVEMGARAGLSPHALAFALDLARGGTVAADAEIVFAGPGVESADEAEAHEHDHEHDHDHDHIDPTDSDVRLAWIEGT